MSLSISWEIKQAVHYEYSQCCFMRINLNISTKHTAAIMIEQTLPVRNELRARREILRGAAHAKYCGSKCCYIIYYFFNFRGLVSYK